MRHVTVEQVSVPAWSTVGYGYGRDRGNVEVGFVGDHRAMREIGDAIAAAETRDDLPVAYVDDTQVIGDWRGQV
jgi:hypothetical protein